MPAARLTWPSRLQYPDRPDPPSTGSTVKPVTPAFFSASRRRRSIGGLDDDLDAFGLVGLHGLSLRSPRPATAT